MASALVAPHAHAMCAAVVGGGRGQPGIRSSKRTVARGARQGEHLILYVLQGARSLPNC